MDTSHVYDTFYVIAVFQYFTTSYKHTYQTYVQHAIKQFKMMLPGAELNLITVTLNGKQ